MHPELLRLRVHQAKADHWRRPGKATSAELEELKALRKEVARLRKINGMLKDASVIFAQELDPATVTRFIEERRSVGIELVCEDSARLRDHGGVSTRYDRPARCGTYVAPTPAASAECGEPAERKCLHTGVFVIATFSSNHVVELVLSQLS